MFQTIQTPFIFIFGASGDLAKVKIFPSSIHLLLSIVFLRIILLSDTREVKKTDERVPSEFRKVKKHCKTIPQNCILRRKQSKIAFSCPLFSGQYTERRDFERYFDF